MKSYLHKFSKGGVRYPNVSIHINLGDICMLDKNSLTFSSSPAAAAPSAHAQSAIVVPIRRSSITVLCSSCNLRKICMPQGITVDEFNQVDVTFSAKREVKAGRLLFRNGEKFTSLFAIRTGAFKSYVALEDGNEQVTGFQMSGELLGLDGIASNHHTCNAMALEDSEVCLMPFRQLEELAHNIPVLQRHFHKIMSSDIFNQKQISIVLAGMRAEARLAAFFLNLVDRLHARGLSQSDILLRMTRQEIGSYLGIKPETVSRVFSKFSKSGLMEVSHRSIRILRMDMLCDLADHCACA